MEALKGPMAFRSIPPNFQKSSFIETLKWIEYGVCGDLITTYPHILYLRGIVAQQGAGVIFSWVSQFPSDASPAGEVKDDLLSTPRSIQ